MAATAQDYLWFTQEFEPEYCVTLARGLTPREFLARIGADIEPSDRDAEGLEEFCADSAIDGASYRLPIGATSVTGDGGPWTLAVEWNGFAGTVEELLLASSAGTRVVSHYRGANAADYFHWFEDGALRLFFEPLFAYYRSGPEAEAIAEQMRACGFDLSEGDDRDFALHTEATFALAERLTGVRLTAQTLREARYLCGVAAIKR